MRLHPAELIQRKRDGGELSADEIQDLVSGVVDLSLGDAQLGAFLMAVCCRGMTATEAGDLTRAMRDSGRVLDLSSIPGVKVDKHSTGGVGDKVSLLLAPWVAAAGVPVPMVSGRGLGHTGGTIDKLQSIPGYRTDLSLDEFTAVLSDCGYVMSSATADLAPADGRMYAVRDISGTVESVPLITSSILAKKLAEGIDGLVMDVKCGRAAFMKTREQAETLMESLVSIGRAAGVDVVALLTDMDAPLGRAVGNAIEVREIVECLRGDGPEDLMEVTRALASEMLVLGGKCPSPSDAQPILDDLMASGRVEQVFAANVARQGGDPSFLEDPEVLPRAPFVEEVLSPSSGWVADVDPLAIGLSACAMGGGRRQPDDRIDPSVGVWLRRKRGDEVAAGEVLAEVHAASADDARRAVAEVEAAYRFAEERVDRGQLVLARVG